MSRRAHAAPKAADARLLATILVTRKPRTDKWFAWNNKYNREKRMRAFWWQGEGKVPDILFLYIFDNPVKDAIKLTRSYEGFAYKDEAYNEINIEPWMHVDIDYHLDLKSSIYVLSVPVKTVAYPYARKKNKLAGKDLFTSAGLPAVTTAETPEVVDTYHRGLDELTEDERLALGLEINPRIDSEEDPVIEDERGF